MVAIAATILYSAIAIIACALVRSLFMSKWFNRLEYSSEELTEFERVWDENTKL